MCTLNNRLCMSTTRNEKEKEIWRLNSSEDTWEKIYTIDLLSCSTSPDLISYIFSLKKKKKKNLVKKILSITLRNNDIWYFAKGL